MVKALGQAWHVPSCQAGNTTGASREAGSLASQLLTGGELHPGRSRLVVRRNTSVLTGWIARDEDTDRLVAGLPDFEPDHRASSAWRPSQAKDIACCVATKAMH